MSFQKLNPEIEALKAHLKKREHSSDSELSVILSPYRISPLGSSIDYQGGPALSMSVSSYTILAFIPLRERKIRLYSMDESGVAEFDPGRVRSAEKNDWRRFIMGAAKLFYERYGAGGGFSGAVHNTLTESGLGTSSSECLAYLNAFARSNNIEPLSWEYPEFVTRIKNDYLREISGTLDQLSTLNGRYDCMLHVNNSSGEVSAHPGPKFGEDYRILIAYSGGRNENDPRDMDKSLAESKEASGFLGIMAGLSSGDMLSDIPPEVFYKNTKRLPPNLRQRAGIYFDEARRVEEGLLAWKKGDLETLGGLMNESCGALIDNDKGLSVQCIMLHRVVSASSGVYGSTINGSYVVGFVTNEFGEDSLTGILQNYKRLCPESQDTAYAFFAEPGSGVKFLEPENQS